MSIVIRLPLPPRAYRRQYRGETRNVIALGWAFDLGILAKNELFDLIPLGVQIETY